MEKSYGEILFHLVSLWSFGLSSVQQTSGNNWAIAVRWDLCEHSPGFGSSPFASPESGCTEQTSAVKRRLHTFLHTFHHLFHHLCQVDLPTKWLKTLTLQVKNIGWMVFQCLFNVFQVHHVVLRFPRLPEDPSQALCDQLPAVCWTSPDAMRA